MGTCRSKQKLTKKSNKIILMIDDPHDDDSSKTISKEVTPKNSLINEEKCSIEKSSKLKIYCSNDEHEICEVKLEDENQVESLAHYLESYDNKFYDFDESKPQHSVHVSRDYYFIKNSEPEIFQEALLKRDKNVSDNHHYLKIYGFRKEACHKPVSPDDWIKDLKKSVDHDLRFSYHTYSMFY